jgi:hypothetical protein
MTWPIDAVLAFAATAVSLLALLVSLSSTLDAVRSRRVLTEIARRNADIRSKLTDFLRDDHFSDRDLMALVASLQQVIEHDLKDAQGRDEAVLRGAKIMISEEALTKEHRLFKELAIEAGGPHQQAA